MESNLIERITGINYINKIRDTTSVCNDLCWSPDGTRIAFTSLKGIRIWNVKSLSIEQKIKCDISTFSWSPDAKVIATGNNFGEIEFWEAKSGRLLHHLKIHSTAIYCLRWSPNGMYVASCSHDGIIKIYNSSLMSHNKTLISHDLKLMSHNSTFKPMPQSQILTISWSPDSKYLVSGSLNSAIIIWDILQKKYKTILSAHDGFIFSTAWSKDGKKIISASSDRTINVYNFETDKLIHVLEGHTDQIVSIDISSDSKFLLSKSKDGINKIWSCENWTHLKDIKLKKTHSAFWTGVAFHPQNFDFVCLGNNEKEILIFRIDGDTLFESNMDNRSIKYVNIKLVLVGESGVGKSGLAHRIAENKFCLTESTHGAKFWQIDIAPESISHRDQKNLKPELTLWDLAGQPEYRIVHQLFLDDTDAAFLLFDCSDVSEPFRGVTYWAKVLNKQSSPNSVKMLISSRCDVCPVTVDKNEIYSLLSKYNMTGYCCTSAKTGEGIEELKQALIKSIRWQELTHTTTPVLFKFIRDILLKAKGEGKTLLLISSLSIDISNSYKNKVNQSEIDTVIKLMQSKGLLHRLNPTKKISYVLLKPELINNYAASIIQGARNNSLGLGNIPERDVLNANLNFSGIDRLELEEERVVLESTIELLIRHDLCLREMGLLIFPSQVNVSRKLAKNKHQQIEVSYNFSGGIETIYASLVVRLSYTDYFQLEDKWKFSAEFSRENKKLGFIMEPKSENSSELGIYFDSNIDDFDRIIFIRFITDHLRTKGLDVQEQIRLFCSCGKEIKNRNAINERIKIGKLNIICQYCDNIVLIPRSIKEHFRKNQDFMHFQQKLEDTVEQRTNKEIENFKNDHKKYSINTNNRCLNLLHISDIHLGKISEAKKYKVQLENDLINELNISSLDYIVISGDIADKSKQDDYDSAFLFIDGIVRRFGLDASRVIVVPGNHDLNWDYSEDSYEFVPARRQPTDIEEGSYINAGNVGILMRNDDLYKKRFYNFSNYFYKKVTGGINYPDDYDKQSIIHEFSKDKILFLSLNSCWETDHHYNKRFSINIFSIYNALEKISGDKYNGWLKFFVLHHPITGSEMLKNYSFLDQLTIHKFCLCLHGHIHEAQKNFYQYDDKRKIHAIGAGTFGAPSNELRPGVPFQYNLLQINASKNEISVYTRKKEKADGAWCADARWGDKNNPSSRYLIRL